jgi:hypothetical protein
VQKNKFNGVSLTGKAEKRTAKAIRPNFFEWRDQFFAPWKVKGRSGEKEEIL